MGLSLVLLGVSPETSPKVLHEAVNEERGMSLQFSRADQSRVTAWLFTIDRTLLTAMFTLVFLGVLISLAASPSVALSKRLPAFFFVQRHIIFAGIAICLMLVVSLFSPRGVRRLALVVFAGSIVAMIAIAVSGEAMNGAKRWIQFAGFTFQPSEVAKPAFVVLVGWAFGEMQRRRDMPALPIAFVLYISFAVLLLTQPDVGQTLLVTLVWGALFLLAGLPLIWVAVFAGTAIAGLGATYFSLGYVRGRIDQFFDSNIAATSQAGRAFHSFMQGGFFGRGAGEGTIKTQLPDAHTDYIFAVIAEEYGVVACMGLVVLFSVIVFRALARAVIEPDLATRYGIAGLALLIGLQALINMGVNVGLLPAKGMTLPMISAGGSSMMGIALTFGMLLALSRGRPEIARGR